MKKILSLILLLCTMVQGASAQTDHTFTVNGVKFTMVAVEGGTFQMGNKDNRDDSPVHDVTLSSSYYIGKTEVTQALWTAVMGSNPSWFKGDDLPVEQVSWYDCQAFIEKLNSLTGRKFRLPTSAEWEFAAKGGTKSQGYIYSGSDNIEEVAWYDSNSSNKTHPVATKVANELGIYDMSGNVWEWCNDWDGNYSSEAQTDPTGPESGTYRVYRGGGWSSTLTSSCRSDHRYRDKPDGPGYSLGFRLALSNEEYPLWVGGTRVTNLNADDVLGNGYGYVTYDAQTQTLTLRGYVTGTGSARDGSTGFGAALYSEVDSLNIFVPEAGATLSVADDDCDAIYLRGKTRIEGEGVLKASGNVGINMYGRDTLTIGGSVMVEVEGQHGGIIGRSRFAAKHMTYFSTLVIKDNAVVHAKSGGNAVCISEWKEIILGDGQAVVAPEGASVLTDEGHYIAVDGKVVTGDTWVVVAKKRDFELTIAHGQVLSGDDVRSLETVVGILAGTKAIAVEVDKEAGLSVIKNSDGSKELFSLRETEDEDYVVELASDLTEEDFISFSDFASLRESMGELYDQMGMYMWGTLSLKFDLSTLPPVVVVKRGDVNRDARVNSADVVAIYNYIVNGAASGISNTSADVNRDGDVNSADAVTVYNIIINGDDEEPAPKPFKNQTFTVNGVQFEMVAVEGGTFQMGSSDGQSSGKPVHDVTLSNYYLGQTEVTQELWTAVMGSNPSYFKGDNLPVERVSWNDCQTFIQKLNQLTGKTFRLPTEAEWEYAAKGGNKSKGYTYSGSNTLDNVAWYWDNSSSKTHDVATKSPNELGIYDMSGNVWEWCQDWYGSYSSSAQINPTGPASGSYRVIRGGGWNNYASDCRAARRSSDTPTDTLDRLGLRLAMSE